MADTRYICGQYLVTHSSSCDNDWLKMVNQGNGVYIYYR